MKEQELLQCWKSNAAGWSDAVRGGVIKSRVVTDRAILNAVGSAAGQNLLDLGCGEGSLARRFTSVGWQVTGIDAVPELLDQARAAGGESYLEGTYDELSRYFPERSFDCIVANFSLLGDESTRSAVDASATLLKPAGRFWIQTLHPETLGPSPPGWRAETWSTLGELSCQSSPWYARDLDGWRSLFPTRLWSLREQSVEDGDGRLLSLILCASSVRGHTDPRT